MFGAGEDQYTFRSRIRQDMLEQLLFFGPLDKKDRLRDFVDGGCLRIHLNPYRPNQDTSAQVLNRLGHGGRKKQGLALLWQGADDPLDIVDKAHIQHAVGFIEDEDFDTVQADNFLVHQIKQAPGCRHQNIDAAPNGIHLWLLTNTAKDHCMFEPAELAEFTEFFINLRRQFAGRRQHEYAYESLDGIGAQRLNNGYDKGSGFAGAGLGATHDIPPIQDLRNGLGLYRCRLGIPGLLDHAKQGFIHS